MPNSPDNRKGGQPAIQTPPIVSPQAWEAARQQMLVKEKAHTRARDALAAERRRMPWMAVERAYAFAGPNGRASLLDLFEGRRQLIVYRAFFEPGRARLARPGLPRLLAGGRPGRPSRPPQCARHDARLRLARAAGRHRAAEGADGLEDALVHHHRQLRRRFRRRRVARPQRVLPRRRPRVPHLFHQQPRRRGDGHALELPRSQSARSPGDLGGFAGRLPPDRDLQVVELARQLCRGAAPDRRWVEVSDAGEAAFRKRQEARS